jgi:hypothetical protein
MEEDDCRGEVERWKRMIDGHEIRGKKIAMIDDL